MRCRERGSAAVASAAAAAAVLLLALVVAHAAAAATVVNGDFEAGSLAGWHVERETHAGDWFAYSGTAAPIGYKRGAAPVQAPPQGRYAATSDEAARDSVILYQDVALSAGQGHQLSMLAYYDSYAPIAVPTPDTLAVDEETLAGQANQQFRIDVMSPSAPLDSVDPADVLRTVFRTRKGAPTRMPPTRLTVDLSAFAGQTVRLRIVNAASGEVFNAGVDAISISDTKPGQSPSQGSNPSGRDRLRIARARANRRNGTVRLSVHVPGPGLLTVVGGSRGHGRRKMVKAVTVKARRAGAFSVRLEPTALGRGTLRRRHLLRVRVAATFIPAAGRRETASAVVAFRLAGRRRR